MSLMALMNWPMTWRNTQPRPVDLSTGAYLTAPRAFPLQIITDWHSRLFEQPNLNLHQTLTHLPTFHRPITGHLSYSYLLDAKPTWRVL